MVVSPAPASWSLPSGIAGVRGTLPAVPTRAPRRSWPLVVPCGGTERTCTPKGRARRGAGGATQSSRGIARCIFLVRGKAVTGRLEKRFGGAEEGPRSGGQTPAGGSSRGSDMGRGGGVCVGRQARGGAAFDAASAPASRGPSGASPASQRLGVPQRVHWHPRKGVRTGRDGGGGGTQRLRRGATWSLCGWQSRGQGPAR